MRRLGPTLALVLGLAGCGGGAHHLPSTLHRGDGITFRVPAGWHVARHSLTPHLTNPHELFTASTGGLAAAPGRCAQFPSEALSAMGARDVLVTVQERYGSDRSFDPRPRHFALAGTPGSE